LLFGRPVGNRPKLILRRLLDPAGLGDGTSAVRSVPVFTGEHMNESSRPFFAVALCSAALAAGCATAGSHGPGHAAGGMADAQAHCEMHRKMMASMTPEQRQAMMSEHMKSMTPEMRQRMQAMHEQCT
jgi:hypothetical protein